MKCAAIFFVRLFFLPRHQSRPKNEALAAWCRCAIFIIYAMLGIILGSNKGLPGALQPMAVPSYMYAAQDKEFYNTVRMIKVSIGKVPRI